MRFSIVTPSFRSSAWLKLCIASVADQTDVEVEHIVQDSCSDDGTQDWLPHDKRVTPVIEKDTGMYDAVNRGYRRASGDIFAYLNCDEQYLPGALAAVADYFEQNPETDALVGDTVVVDSRGEYLCHRYAFAPTPDAIWVRFSVLTSALFIRRRVHSDMGVYFDTKWKDMGDFFYVEELTRRGVRFGELRRCLASFTDTGENMNLKPNAIREKLEKRAMAPLRARLLWPWHLGRYLWRKSRAKAHTPRPFEYEIYTPASPAARVRHRVERLVSHWPGRSGKVSAPSAG
jgi:glycosyltransferase involved in cell wall biosynthesis